jgi:hypothetical protein
MDHLQVSAAISQDTISDSGERRQSSSNLDGAALLADRSILQASNQKENTASGYLPGLDLGDFKQAAQKMLETFPQDESGNYVGADLVRMVDNPDLKGKDAVVAATIYRLYEGTLGCSIDTSGGGGGHGGGSHGGGSHGRGRAHDHETHTPAPVATEITCSHAFSAHDIADLRPPLNDSAKTLDEFSKLTNLDLFNLVDLDHDGNLSSSELAASARFAPLATEVPALGQALAASKNGLPYVDLRHLYGQESRNENQFHALQFSLEHAAKGLDEATSRDLFADRDNPLASIKMADVLQGTAGDCYFEAVLASVAGSKPEIIRDSIKDNQNGTYTVTFKGDVEHPVTVSRPTDTELAIYSRGSKDGIWAPVMEKAFGRYSVDVLKRPQFDGTEQDATYGGLEMPVMKLLTGADATTYHTASFYPNVHQNIPPGDPAKLNDAAASSAIAGLADGSLVTIGTASGQEKETGLDGRHAYTVVSYTPGAQGGIFRLRDPRGPMEGKNDYPEITGDQLRRSPLTVSVGSLYK